MREFRKIYDLDILNLKPIFHDKIYNIEFFSILKIGLDFFSKTMRPINIKFVLNIHFVYTL